MFQTLVMTDPTLYLSMLLGLGGVYVLISSFHDDDDGDDDGEKCIYNLKQTYLANSWFVYKNTLSSKGLLQNRVLMKIVL